MKRMKLRDVRILIRTHGLADHVSYSGRLEYLPAQMFGKLNGVYLFCVRAGYMRRFRAFCRLHRIQDMDSTVWSNYPASYAYRAIITPPEKFADRHPWRRDERWIQERREAS